MLRYILTISSRTEWEWRNTIKEAKQEGIPEHEETETEDQDGYVDEVEIGKKAKKEGRSSRRMRQRRACSIRKRQLWQILHLWKQLLKKMQNISSVLIENVSVEDVGK